MHELGPESNFNESMYINCFDPTQGVGGWFRIGNRANEGNAEMTVCLYLPAVDGGRSTAGGISCSSVPRSANNDAFDAAGLTWTGARSVRDTPASTTSARWWCSTTRSRWPNPQAGVHEQPVREAEVHLTFHRSGSPSMFGGEPDDTARDAGRGVREGALRAARRGDRARSSVGGREWEIERLRPPRPLVGTALLAGALVLPLADRQRRCATSASWRAESPSRTARAPAAASCGRAARSTTATRSRSPPVTRGDEHYHDTNRVSRCDRARSTGSGRVARRDDRPHPAAQPTPDTRRRVAADPHLGGLHEVDRARPATVATRTGSATGCRSTSTRSSTAPGRHRRVTGRCIDTRRPPTTSTRPTTTR